jgi:hypothetical protein
MSLVRNLEKRLEKLLEGVAERVFSARLHPSEIAGKLAREADFARFEHETGPATANSFTILINPRDLTLDVAGLQQTLTKEMVQYTTEEGLRLEGPVSVRIEESDVVAPGGATCHVEVTPGPTVAWAKLLSDETAAEIGRNRSIIGRSRDADVVIDRGDVSRAHALIWRQSGQAWLRDLESANGTSVDGQRLVSEPTVIQSGSVLDFSGHQYRFMEM